MRASPALDEAYTPLEKFFLQVQDINVHHSVSDSVFEVLHVI